MRSWVVWKILTFLMPFCPAKILVQLQSDKMPPPIPIEILLQAKTKEPPSNALPELVMAYTGLKRIGVLTKDSPSGKMIDDWNKLLSESESKPTTFDVSPVLAALLVVRDEEEPVSNHPPFLITILLLNWK